jgi:hypothetical protein
MTTKDVWSKIDVRYSGKVNLVVFDFTDEAAVAASEAEATRLGLGGFFADYGGWTGTIVIVGVNKDVRAELHGTRDFDEYATAIDAAIAAATKDSP